VLFLSAAGAVLLGTLWPLFVDALGLEKQSVGPPYFDVVFVPLMTPALFLMGIGRWPLEAGQLAGDRTPAQVGVRRQHRDCVAAAAGAGTLVALAAFGLWLALWIFAATIVNLWSRLRPLWMEL